MCLQKPILLRRKDGLLVPTGLDQCEGMRLIAEALREIPNEDCAKAVEEVAPARGADKLHKDQSIRLCKTISQGQPIETRPYLSLWSWMRGAPWRLVVIALYLTATICRKNTSFLA